MSKSGLSVTDEEIFETIVRMLTSADEIEAASLVRRGRCRFEHTGYDNWNGGTNSYTLSIEIDAETYVVLHNRQERLEEQITKRLSQAVEQLTTDWYAAKLVPSIVALPGRPDLRGGAVSERTRKNIVDMLRRQKVSWSGVLLETDFLAEIFDLAALPSRDSRSPTWLGTFGSIASITMIGLPIGSTMMTASISSISQMQNFFNLSNGWSTTESGQIMRKHQN